MRDLDVDNIYRLLKSDHYPTIFIFLSTDFIGNIFWAHKLLSSPCRAIATAESNSYGLHLLGGIMNNFFNSKIVLLLAIFSSACLAMQGQALATPINNGTDWNYSCNGGATCTFNGTTFSAGLTQLDGPYDMGFWEKGLDSQELRLGNVQFAIANMLNGFDITGLTLTIIDKHDPSGMGGSVHPGVAHFHDLNLSAVVDQNLPGESKGSVTTNDLGNTNYFTAIDISGLFLRPGRTVDIFGSSYLGPNGSSQHLSLHQYGNGLVERGFDIFITARGVPEAAVPLPGTLLLLLSGFAALIAQAGLRRTAFPGK